VVVDHEKGAGVAGDRPQTACQRQQLAPGEQLLAKLKDVSATPKSGRGKVDQAIGVLVGGDDVEAGS